jgi:TolB protein
MRRTSFKLIGLGCYLGLGGLLLRFAVTPSAAQQEDVRFKVTNPGQAQIKVAVPAPAGDAQSGALVQEVLSNDLSLSGFFKVLDPRSFLADDKRDELGITPETWRSVGAEAVVKARASTIGGEAQVECRVFQVVQGDAPVVNKTLRGPVADLRRLSHRCADEVVRYFGKEDSFFASQIAFASERGAQREISVMDWDGAGVRQVTSNGSQNILPSWHPSGGSLLYTSFARGTPDLFSIGIGGGRGKRLSTRQGLNTGGVWSPDGRRIALTLSQDGNAEIYLLSAEGAVISRLTNNPFIDSSPTWSPDGSQIAFVSDRYGTPQIWVMSASGAGQTKLTKRGNYNQEPAWSPRQIDGKSLIAFSARDERGAFDIFTVNPKTQDIVRLTENRGSNLHPSWAPNGRAIAYESSRGGIWVATADGRTEKQVYRGKASSPSWGPMPK